MNTKIKNLLILIIPNFMITIMFLFVKLDYINAFFKYFLLLGTILPSAFILVYGHKTPKILYKFFLLTCYACSLGLLIYSFLYSNNLLKYFSSITATKELILSTGAMGSIIFIFIQIAQVVFLPIPAIALLVVGILIYGMWQTAIYCTIGVLLGSYISFLFGKTFGYKFVSWSNPVLNFYPIPLFSYVSITSILLLL